MKERMAASPDQFARVAGSPGEGARVAGLLRVMWPFFLLAFGAGYLVRAAWPVPYLPMPLIGGAFLFLAGVLAWSVTVGRRRLDAYVKGARGEEWVARTLGFLPASYRVYHGMQFTRAWRARDYDHVVVGPTGIFLIETKYWSGRISVEDGRVLYEGIEPDRPPLEQVKDAAAHLRKELREAVDPDVDVQPVLCFVAGSLPGDRTGATGVVICTDRVLTQVLQESPETAPTKEILAQTVYYLDRRGES